MQLKSGATFIIINIIIKFIWHAEFIDLQRSCSSQRGSFPTPPGSGGCWRRRPEGCLSLPLWREIQREKRTVNTCCSSASAQKSHPRPRKRVRERARKLQHYSVCLRFISCTHDPVAPWRWLDDLWPGTWTITRHGRLVDRAIADPVAKAVASIDAVPCPTLETKSLQMLNSVHKFTSTETA